VDPFAGRSLDFPEKKIQNFKFVKFENRLKLKLRACALSILVSDKVRFNEDNNGQSGTMAGLG
jgi:hypothetical protein